MTHEGESMNHWDVADRLGEIAEMGIEEAHVEEDKLMVEVLTLAAEGEDVRDMATMLVAGRKGRTRWYA